MSKDTIKKLHASGLLTETTTKEEFLQVFIDVLAFAFFRWKFNEAASAMLIHSMSMLLGVKVSVTIDGKVVK